MIEVGIKIKNWHGAPVFININFLLPKIIFTNVWLYSKTIIKVNFSINNDKIFAFCYFWPSSLYL